jgi:hypothetical protein
MEQRKKLKGNQCIACEKTHEECVGTSCTRSNISEYVCRMFGTLPHRVIRRSNIKH